MVAEFQEVYKQWTHDEEPETAQKYLDCVQKDFDLGDEGSGENFLPYLIQIMKEHSELAEQAISLCKQQFELDIKYLADLRENPLQVDQAILQERQIVDMIDDLSGLADTEYSEFALNLIQNTLKNVKFQKPELTGNEEYDGFILHYTKLRKSDREIETQLYDSLYSFLDSPKHCLRCLDIVEENLDNIKSYFDGMANLLVSINRAYTNRNGTLEISDRVLETANKLWLASDKAPSFKEGTRQYILGIIQDVSEKSPEKAREALPLVLDMYKYSNNQNSETDELEIEQRLDCISTIVDIAPEKFEMVLKDLEEIASFSDEYDESLGEITQMLRKGLKANPALKENALPVLAKIVANDSYRRSDAEQIAGHMLSGIVSHTVQNNPDKLNDCWKIMESANSFSVIYETIKQIDDENILKSIIHKKEEAYGNIDYGHIRTIEKAFEDRHYIAETLNKKYPNLSLEEQLMQAAYDVVNSGDEQKKKEFNEFILAEGEPRLYQLDAQVMNHLHNKCTQSNLDKVNALRSFYGLKVELQTGNAVDADERTAVRKVFDRTWSSYERGTNAETGEPYKSEAAMEKDRKQNPKQVKTNPYYENSVSPAYREYFETHDIYDLYQSGKHREDGEKKYTTQNYFDEMIDKSPFKALRKHGLYNDMKIICETLEALQVEPEIAAQFNLKDLSDMVVNSHNTLSDRMVYTRGYEEEYMFTKSPHTDELDGDWRDPYYWHQYDDDDDEYNDEYTNDDYEDYEEVSTESSTQEKQFDEEGFEIIPDTDNYSEKNEEVAARDAWWEDLADHNPKAIKFISDAFRRHGREDDAIDGFWEAASYGTPGVGSRRDERLLSATLHHAQAIQYGGNDDKNNFVGAVRYYDDYGSTFAKDHLHLDVHKSFHRNDTPSDALYVNPEAKSPEDRLATKKPTNEDSQKAFLITSFTDPHMHFYAGYRKIDQYTDPIYKMRNIEKENQERVAKTEAALDYLTKLGNALVSISTCISEALKTEEKIKTSTEKVSKAVKSLSNNKDTPVNKKYSTENIKSVAKHADFTY